MAGNTKNTGDFGKENIEGITGRLGEDIKNLVQTGAQRVALLTSMGLGALAQQAAAEEHRTYNYTPAVVTESGDICETPNPELSEAQLETCFGQDFVSIEDENLKALLAEVWQSYTQEQKASTIGFFAGGFSASEAIAEVADKNNRSLEATKIIHFEAINIGNGEFITNMSSDPELEGLTTADFEAYRDELMSGFIDGTDNSMLEEFVRYAPRFTEYVLTFPDDFKYAEALQSAYNIAESEANIAESEANIAESEANIAESEANIAELNQRQAALRLLISKLDKGV